MRNTGILSSSSRDFMRLYSSTTWGSSSTRIWIFPPSWVYFTALERRLIKIWLIRSLSAHSFFSVLGAGAACPLQGRGKRRLGYEPMRFVNPGFWPTDTGKCVERFKEYRAGSLDFLPVGCRKIPLSAVELSKKAVFPKVRF